MPLSRRRVSAFKQARINLGFKLNFNLDQPWSCVSLGFKWGQLYSRSPAGVNGFGPARILEGSGPRRAARWSGPNRAPDSADGPWCGVLLSDFWSYSLCHVVHPWPSGSSRVARSEVLRRIGGNILQLSMPSCWVVGAMDVTKPYTCT